MVERKVVGDIQSDPDTGRVFDEVLKEYLIMLDANFYRGLRNKLYETFQSGAHVILYSIGLGYGEVAGKKIVELGGSRIDAYKIFMQTAKRQGYGLFQVPLLESLVSGFTGELVIRLKNSFFALAAGNTNRVECQIVAGMIAGAAPYALGKKDLDCIEKKCIAKGDSYCEFHLKSH